MKRHQGAVGRTTPRRDGSTGYCGPTALTVVAGVTTEQAEDVLRAFRKRNGHDVHDKTRIVGVYSAELRDALHQFGVWCDRAYHRSPRQTLASWLGDPINRERYGRQYAILMIGTGSGLHYIVVKGNRYWDQLSKDTGSPRKKAPHRRGQVREVLWCNPGTATDRRFRAKRYGYSLDKIESKVTVKRKTEKKAAAARLHRMHSSMRQGLRAARTDLSSIVAQKGQPGAPKIARGELAQMVERLDEMLAKVGG